eukprot:scpid39407/ scgid30036/ Ankyrin repeat and zinc finger domain-containing protein 1; Zinc finger protein 744
MLSLNDKGTRHMLSCCSLYSEGCIRQVTTSSHSPNDRSSMASVMTDGPRPVESSPASASGLTCILCDIRFASRNAQVEHARLDWHRFNLRQQLAGRPAVTEDVFDEIALGSGVSSISGSDCDSDGEDLAPHGKKKPISNAPDQDSDNEDGAQSVTSRAGNKVFLEAGGSVYSIHRVLVNPSKVSYDSDQLKQQVDKLLAKPMYTVIIMLSAGHFAGAVFNGSTVVVHKTFHRYVVRAKRGTAQSVHDSQGHHAKSAGANIRRHNEAALKLEVAALFQQWSEHIAAASLIFLRVPLYQRPVFFAGRTPLLEKGSPRIRTIPFPTRRPTFREVQRVHTNLFTLTPHGLVSDFQDSLATPPTVRSQSVFAKDKRSPSPGSAAGSRTPPSSSPQSSLTRRERHRMENPRYQQLPSDMDVFKSDTTATNSTLDDPTTSSTVEDTIQNGGDDIPELSTTEETIDLADRLQELVVDFGNGRPPIGGSLSFADGHSASRKKQRGGGKNKKSSREASDSDKQAQHAVVDESVVFGDQLLTACRTGNVPVLKSLLMQCTMTQRTATAVATASHASCTSNSEVSHDASHGQEEQRHCTADTEPGAGQSSASADAATLSGDCSGSSINPSPSDAPAVAEAHVSNTGASNADQCSLVDQDDNGTAAPAAASPALARSCSQPPVVVDFDVDTVLSSAHTQQLLNSAVGAAERRLLVVASESAQASVVQLLLECGSDPGSKGKRESKAYAAAQDKTVRDTFRRFRGQHPDRYDYQAAGVDAPLTDDVEADRERKKAEKRKQQRQTRQKKEKEKKAEAKRLEEEQQKRQEEEKEKRWYAALSDREKRALAAERRLQAQQLSNSNCCGLCGRSLEGVTPFSKYDMKYCSMDCLKSHQAKMAAAR